MKTETVAMTVRTPEFPVDDIFLNRWSPRAMSGEEIPREELMSLFEAAKWAPSSYNNQPWRFIYARRGTAEWDTFLSFLGPFNRSWAEKAAALVVIASKETFDHDGKPSRTHCFDAGAAWACLALQGAMNGLVVHGMEGFDYHKAQREIEAPEGYSVQAMAAIGRPGHKEDLPRDLQDREEPSQRKKLSEIVFEGKFTGGPKPSAS